MKRIFHSLTLAAALTFAFGRADAQFTTGNIVVLQVGDGTALLSSAGTALFLKEYNTSTLSQTNTVSTVPIPVTGAARLVNSGTATSEGQITLSQDSTKIVISGYDTTIGYASVASSTTANVGRAIDTVGNAGIVGKADTTKTAFSGNNIRGAARSSLDNFWAVGGTTGIYYMGNTAAPAVVYNTTTNFRVINAVNGKIYFSAASGLSRIMRINSQPTSGPAIADTMIVLGTGNTPAPDAFAVNAAETIVYVADERTNGPGGIQKWTGSGTTWTLAYTFAVGTASGARGIAVDWSSTYPVIYATTNTGASSGGNLIKITDSNSTAPFSILATAVTNTAFRSVAFAPKPACTTPQLSATVTPYSCGGNGAISIAVTGGSAPVTYSYTGPGGYTAATQNISNLQAGTYVLTATAAGGCVATVSSVVANNATLTATVTPGGTTTFCAGSNVVLSANTGAGFSYQWNNANGPINLATNATYTATASGVYTVTITSGVNCTATSSPITVTVGQPPVSTIIANGSTTFCAGSSVQLCVSPNPGPVTDQWYLNGTVIAGANSNCITATVSGTYCVTVSSGAGCTSSSCQIVTAGAPPPANVTPTGLLAICANSSVVLHTNNAPGLTIQWYDGTTAIPSATDSTYTVTAAGNYMVTVSAGAGCSSTSSPVVVTVNPVPVAYIGTVSPDICVGSNSSFTTGPAGNTYQYLLNGAPIAAATTQIFNFVAATAGTFTLSAVVTSPQGCADTSTSLTVTAHPKPVPVITYAGGMLSTTQAFAGYHWVLNGTPIAAANATQATYAPQVNGVYNVEVWDMYGCNDTAQIAIIVTGVGIHDIAGINGVNVYPNPASTFLNIDAAFAVNITLRDLQGRVVMQQSDAKKIDIGNLADGVYQLQATEKKGNILGAMRVVKMAK